MIIQNKLLPPPTPQTLLQRDRIIKLLDRAYQVQLTLVLAPAGFGKSTALAQWLEQREHHYTWLALDQYDDEPSRFWQHLYWACQRLGIAADQGLESLFEHMTGAAAQHCCAYLINEFERLQGDTPFFIVLDDFHCINNELIIKPFLHLLRYLPPSVNLIISSRVKPPLNLAQHRLRSGVLEIDADALNFSYEECAAFLHQCAPSALGDDDLDLIFQQTQGWIGAIKLTGLSVAHRGSFSKIEYQKNAKKDLHQYLIEQIYNPLPADLKKFLLFTAQLPRFSSELINDAEVLPLAAEDYIFRIEAAGLFLTGIDAERQWFRYHDLFKTLLTSRLSNDERRLFFGSLARCKTWFVEHGFYEEALDLALALKDWHDVVTLYIRIMARFLQSGAGAASLSRLTEVPGHIILASPYMSLCYARSGSKAAGDLSITQLLDNAERLVRETLQQLSTGKTIDSQDLRHLALGTRDECLSLLAEILLYRSLLHAALFDTQAEANTLREVLGLGQEHNRHQLMKINFALARSTLAEDGNLPKSIEYYKRAINLSIEDKHLEYIIYCGMELLLKLSYQGKISESFSWNERIWSFLREQGWSSIPELRLLRASELGIRNLTMDLERSEHIAEEIRTNLEMGEAGREFIKDEKLIILRYLVQHHAAKREFDKAIQLLQSMERSVTPFRADRAIGGFFGISLGALRAKVALQAGQLGIAVDWARSSETRLTGQSGYIVECDRLILAQIYIHDERFEQADALLQSIREEAASGGRYFSQLKTLILEALLQSMSGNTDRATATMASALELSRTHCRAVLAFTEEGPEVKRLLETCPANGADGDYRVSLLEHFRRNDEQSAGDKTDCATLSDKEQAILRLIKQGTTNKVISRQMNISIPTVKWHLQNIYRKLGVRTRTGAVFRAERSLGLTFTCGEPIKSHSTKR